MNERLHGIYNMPKMAFSFVVADYQKAKFSAQYMNVPLHVPVIFINFKLSGWMSVAETKMVCIKAA